MNTQAIAACCAIAILAAGCRSASKEPSRPPASERRESEWQQDFGLAGRVLATTGRNPYFILEPGFRLMLASKDERLIITVLAETVRIGDVDTRVVEEREWQNGELIEVSRNFFAICPETKDVFYFGEEVDVYRNGKLVGHGGAWRADQIGSKPGLIMPGSPEAGMKYYQEIAPGVAMDRAEVVGLNASLKTPVGTFDGCLEIREGSALKPMEEEFKMYARGIGLLWDGDMLLAGHGYVDEP